MKSLPGFDLPEYRSLVLSLVDHGYELAPVSAMKRPRGKRTAFLRHDIDFSPEAALPMARLEAELGCVATYYFLHTGPYDLTKGTEGDALKEIASMGHEIGLHYDLMTYPDQEMEEHLKAECRHLAALSGVDINTITMHQPHQGGGDPFREHADLFHPHDPRYQGGVTYISDSCRAWRDETLLTCFGDHPPERLLLLTHPALWLDGSVEDRMTYLEEVLVSRASAEHKGYFQQEVSQIWRDHPGAKAHDLREKVNGELKSHWIDLPWVTDRMEELLTHFAAFDAVPWGEAAIVSERPEKWDLSLALTRDENVVSFSFNSRKGDALHIHAFYVAKVARREGLGNRMIEALSQRASSRGLSFLRLAVHESNDSARRFYLEQGFTVVEREEGHNQYQMERPVS